VSAQRSSIIGEREHSARYRRHFAGDSSRAACKNREALALLLPPLSKLSGNMPDRAGNMPALPDLSLCNI